MFLTLCFAVVFKYGQDYWYPVWAELNGKKSVPSVLWKLKDRIEPLYSEIDTLTDGRDILLIGLKEERQIELWKHFPDGWRHVKNFPFMGFSGKLGPKLKEGDMQIPEGLYEIEYLNPNSTYHLSMKLTYPNEFDMAKGIQDGRLDLGYDIFIHGNRMTIGCIPICNAGIEELFYIVAKNGYKNTKVIISPYDMRIQERDLEIEGIDWEDELYAQIKEALKPFAR